MDGFSPGWYPLRSKCPESRTDPLLRIKRRNVFSQTDPTGFCICINDYN